MTYIKKMRQGQYINIIKNTGICLREAVPPYEDNSYTASKSNLEALITEIQEAVHSQLLEPISC